MNESFYIKFSNDEENHHCNSFIKKQQDENIIILKNFFNRNTCNWFIIESEKYAEINCWDTNRHETSPTTDILISNVKHIWDFAKFIINAIKMIIIKEYNISSSTIFYIDDAFVVKYETGKQDELNIHTDSSDYTINISLSDLTDYDGGGTFFKIINKTISCEIGDVLIHPGYLKHSGIKITRGKRYLLVIFLKIKNKK